jgi:putative membrane protein insertion efficiency factor
MDHLLRAIRLPLEDRPGLPMDAGPNRPTRAALVLLAGYQRWVSPLLPGGCRFWPTCSEYARLALLRHGLVRGGGLALWRLCRCHRFARGGFDPPP